ncbi:MAG: NAD(P)/FAD-dependent oxidoreductase [Bryobacteraceae bacterium]
MNTLSRYDAVVIGSGPNGLSAAIVVAQTGRSVLVVEADPQIGGGTRSAELTVPGFLHDVCSAVHPMAVATSFFRSLPLEKHGLEWIHPPLPLAHPFDDGSAAVLHRSLETTCSALGNGGEGYRNLIGPVVANWDAIEADALGPERFPRHPWAAARFGLRAIRSAESLARDVLKTERSRALFAGLAAHSVLPLDQPATAAIGLVLGAAAHVAGWPIPRGGSQRIADALASYLRSLGGEIVTGWRVRDLDELPKSAMTLCDLSPRGLLAIAGDRLPASYRQAFTRYRYGAGVFKLDWALREPIPWRNPDCAKAGTIHLGGTLQQISESELAPARAEHAERPFVLLAQPSLFDDSRAPHGQHTAWAYCHVPNGSSFDMTERIENQVERFAPGFKDRILARSVMPPALLEQHNANLVGGDITGGSPDLRQLFFRPTWRTYSTPAKGLYLCSSSTPPGAGVHGLCGYFAAKRALAEVPLT